MIHQQNITTLIEGSYSRASACAISLVMGVSVIRLPGSGEQFDQCERAVDMSAGYRYFAHATFDVLSILKWRRLLLIFDGDLNILAWCYDREPIYQNKKTSIPVVGVETDTPRFFAWSTPLMLFFPLLFFAILPSYSHFFLPGIFRVYILTFPG